jgi:hypothetical protein
MTKKPKQTTIGSVPQHPAPERDTALSVHHFEHIRRCRCAPRRGVRGGFRAKGRI